MSSSLPRLAHRLWASVRPDDSSAYWPAYLADPKASSVEFAALGSARSEETAESVSVREATASEVLEPLATEIGWSRPSRESTEEGTGAA